MYTHFHLGNIDYLHIPAQSPNILFQSRKYRLSPHIRTISQYIVSISEISIIFTSPHNLPIYCFHLGNIAYLYISAQSPNILFPSRKYRLSSHIRTISQYIISISEISIIFTYPHNLPIYCFHLGNIDYLHISAQSPNILFPSRKYRLSSHIRTISQYIISISEISIIFTYPHNLLIYCFHLGNIDYLHISAQSPNTLFPSRKYRLSSHIRTISQYIVSISEISIIFTSQHNLPIYCFHLGNIDYLHIPAQSPNILFPSRKYRLSSHPRTISQSIVSISEISIIFTSPHNLPIYCFHLGNIEYLHISAQSPNTLFPSRKYRLSSHIRTISQSIVSISEISIIFTSPHNLKLKLFRVPIFFTSHVADTIKKFTWRFVEKFNKCIGCSNEFLRLPGNIFSGLQTQLSTVPDRLA